AGLRGRRARVGAPGAQLPGGKVRSAPRLAAAQPVPLRQALSTAGAHRTGDRWAAQRWALHRLLTQEVLRPVRVLTTTGGNASWWISATGWCWLAELHVARDGPWRSSSPGPGLSSTPPAAAAAKPARRT